MIEIIKKFFKNNLKINERHFKKLENYNRDFEKNLPFKHLIIENFLDKKTFNYFEKVLKKQEYDYFENDIYKFYKTKDFDLLKDNKKILEIRNFFLEKNIVGFFEKMTNSKIKRDDLVLHSILLKKNNYLLPHSDEVDKRRFAFILNFSNLEEKNKDGGSLVLFNGKKEIKKIYPKKNNLVIFEVSNKSLHMIEEVFNDKKRLTIGGWYY